MSVDVVIGGQFGSEGKGSVVSWLARQAHYDLAIRIGGVNAGHTFIPFQGMKDAKPVAMRQLPACWDSVENMYLASGAIVDLKVFDDEIDMVECGGQNKVYISPYATVQSEDDKLNEIGLTHQIGSTGKGVGAARAQRIMRHATIARDVKELKPFCIESDIKVIINNPASRILVETSQGFGLSLMHRFYPYCTSANLDVWHSVGDADIPWNLHKVNVYLVFRTFPIRVAGTSGVLVGETTWDKLQLRYGKHIPVEMTTVTKKVRRVGEFDPRLYNEAVSVCHPTYSFLTFADYLAPKLAGLSGKLMYDDLKDYSLELETLVSLMPSVKWLGTGIGTFLELVNTL